VVATSLLVGDGSDTPHSWGGGGRLEGLSCSLAGQQLVPLRPGNVGINLGVAVWAKCVTEGGRLQVETICWPLGDGDGESSDEGWWVRP
jgi:hypothetical protein